MSTVPPPPSATDWVSLETFRRTCKLAVVCSEDQKLPQTRTVSIGARWKRAQQENEKRKSASAAPAPLRSRQPKYILWQGRNYYAKPGKYGLRSSSKRLEQERIMEAVPELQSKWADGITGAERKPKSLFRQKRSRLSPDERRIAAIITPTRAVFRPKTRALHRAGNSLSSTRCASGRQAGLRQVQRSAGERETVKKKKKEKKRNSYSGSPKADWIAPPVFGLPFLHLSFFPGQNVAVPDRI
ncbi:hypothetical protein FQR65_LT20892 [Abscondita terminalis]|nr:hypothetical protein FQR65_LT20892 [Abscondita terminalis]